MNVVLIAEMFHPMDLRQRPGAICWRDPDVFGPQAHGLHMRRHGIAAEERRRGCVGRRIRAARGARVRREDGGGAVVGEDDGVSNNLEDAAVTVAPRLAAWRDHFADVCGQRPRLSGSGSTWFVEGAADELGIDIGAGLSHGGQHALLVATRTSPGVE